MSSTVPTTLTHHFKTPFSEGIQRFPVWRPWLDEGDDQRVFFASVQGYGRKAPGIDAYVYPGSGATCDTRPEGKLETAVDAAGHAVLEDPDVSGLQIDAQSDVGTDREGPRAACGMTPSMP